MVQHYDLRFGKGEDGRHTLTKKFEQGGGEETGSGKSLNDEGEGTTEKLVKTIGRCTRPHEGERGQEQEWR